MTLLRDPETEFAARTDVVIAGGGACGMTAAIAARESGAEVIVLERDARPAGSTAMSYGAICAAGSDLQRRAGIDDDAQQLAEDILAATRGHTDTGLAEAVAAASGDTIDWLLEHHRLRLNLDTQWTGLGHRHPRLHAPPDRSGETLLGMLQQAAEAAGADVLTEACVNGVYADAQDRVRGVRIRRPGGDTESLGCAALVLATCGFGANREWVRRYLPGLATARYYGHEGNLGDGIAWGMALGGAVADMGACQALGSLATPQSLVMPHTLMIGGGVQVNTLGERFENELDNISGQALTIIEQPDGICWIVYDQRLHDAALEGYREYRDGVAVGLYRTADSWAALAAETGLPADRLEATMTLVDRHAVRGEPDAFGRVFDAAERLRPPFFAVRVTGALFHTQGGLVVDAAARVRREDGTPLPNLFAGGGAARGLSGPAEWGYLPGMGLCTAVTLGRIAGRAAARVAAEAGDR